MKYSYTFIDLAPIEYEVLTSVLAEEHIHCSTKQGPDYDNYIMKAGYNVTVFIDDNRLNFIRYLYNKKLKLYEDFKKMYDLPSYSEESNTSSNKTVGYTTTSTLTIPTINCEAQPVRYYVKDGEVYRETNSNEKSEN